MVETPLTQVVGLQAGQPHWRILVVDDNRENRMLLNNLLAQTGFSVQEAENGQEAIALFKDWQPPLDLDGHAHAGIGWLRGCKADPQPCRVGEVVVDRGRHCQRPGGADAKRSWPRAVTT